MAENFLEIKNYNLSTLIAIAQTEQERGLMFKSWPPPVMTFLYPNTLIRNFWMKNTPSPLDLIFINGEKIVSLAIGNPFSLQKISSQVPCNSVVELPLGFVKKMKVVCGDYVKFQLSPKTLAKHYHNMIFNV